MVILLVALEKCHQQLYKNILNVRDNRYDLRGSSHHLLAVGFRLWQTKGFIYEALADMEQLYNHIDYVLQALENAMNQYNRIADAILTLDTMAERICIMESEPERSKEMRRLLVDNYSVFFCNPGR